MTQSIPFGPKARFILRFERGCPSYNTVIDQCTGMEFVTGSVMDALRAAFPADANLEWLYELVIDTDRLLRAGFYSPPPADLQEKYGDTHSRTCLDFFNYNINWELCPGTGIPETHASQLVS